MRPLPRKPEVLSPAGDADSLAAAVRAGADAIYFGLQDYNARIRARNFAVEDLPDIVAGLHRDGVRAYVAFNTLLFGPERKKAFAVIEKIAAAAPDAVLVQDLGIAALDSRPPARSHSPRVDADDDQQPGRNRLPLALRDPPGDPGTRVDSSRDHSTAGANRDRAGSVRPWSPLRLVLGPVPVERGVGRPIGQSRAVRAGMPASL